MLTHLAFTPQALGVPHSLMSTQSSFGSPVYPDGHSQVKLPSMLVHLAPLPHGDDAHSSISLLVRQAFQIKLVSFQTTLLKMLFHETKTGFFFYFMYNIIHDIYILGGGGGIVLIS